MERDPRPLEVIVALICGAADVPQNILYCFTGDPRFNVTLRVINGAGFYTHKTLMPEFFPCRRPEEKYISQRRLTALSVWRQPVDTILRKKPVFSSIALIDPRTY